MPLPVHVAGAAGWWYLCLIACYAHHYNKRPRLDAAPHRVDRYILQPGRSASLIRVTMRELNHLCQLLFVNPQLPRTHNWRYSDLHRLVIALYSLANPNPLRKASYTFGWSIASLQHNLHVHVDLIIRHLDGHASRTLFATCMLACLRQRADSLSCCAAPSVLHSIPHRRLDDGRAVCMDRSTFRPAAVPQLHRHRRRHVCSCRATEGCTTGTPSVLHVQEVPQRLLHGDRRPPRYACVSCCALCCARATMR